MKVADLIVKALEKEGVRYVFGVPGEETQALQFALADHENITFIPCRHEQGAAFMANVWGRITGTAGVCMSTLGPGATNLVTGIADANLDKAPVVAITGQGSLERLHHESHQNIDVVNMFAPITKWNTNILTPEVAPEVIRKAFKLAQMEKPGATHVELSEDVAQQKAKDSLQPLNPTDLRRPEADTKALAQAVQLIDRAAYPLILAGNGAVRTRASEWLTNLVRFTNFPVVSTFMGKGAVSDNLPQSLLAVGLSFKDYVAEAFDRADLIITVGYDIAEYSPDQWNPGGRTDVIHIDFEPAEVYESYQPKVEIIGDLADGIYKLFDSLSRGNDYRNLNKWYAPIRQRILDDIESYQLESEAETFHVPGLVHLVRKHLKKDGLLISDVGSHKMWIARNFPTYCPNGCLISNGLASMGIALPGGIAAALAQQDRQVVVMAGDGGFMMNVQELATAQLLGLSFTIVLVNDNNYGLISWKQEREADRTAGTQLRNPDFVKLAQSFGIEAHRPKTAAELDEQLEAALNSSGVQLIEVPVETEVNSELTRKLEEYFTVGRSASLTGQPVSRIPV